MSPDISPEAIRAHARRTTTLAHGVGLGAVVAVGTLAAGAVVIWYRQGGTEAATAILVALASWVALGVIVLGQYVYRRSRARGDILAGKLIAANNVLDSAERRITELEKEVWKLQHPHPLDIHVQPPIEPHLWDELEQHADLGSSRGYLLVFSDLSITNRSDEPMALDLTVTLKLLEPRILYDGMTVRLCPISLEGRKVPFHAGILAVPAKKNRAPNIAFLLRELDAIGAGGPKNIADDGHSLTIEDRVSGKTMTLSFGVSRSPIMSITRNPFAAGDARLTALRDTLEPLTNAKLLNIHVRIGDAAIEDGPKEHSGDPMDYGHLLILKDVAVTNRSDIDMTLDYNVDLRLREPSVQHSASGYVRAYPLKVPGGIVHSGYLEVPAHGTRTIVIGLLLPQVALLAGGGIHNIANQDHMVWFTDRVSEKKNVTWFKLIRLGLDLKES
jgi:hypothetical protein